MADLNFRAIILILIGLAVAIFIVVLIMNFSVIFKDFFGGLPTDVSIPNTENNAPPKCEDCGVKIYNSPCSIEDCGKLNQLWEDYFKKNPDLSIKFCEFVDSKCTTSQ